jgi:hypothetical protein
MLTDDYAAELLINNRDHLQRLANRLIFRAGASCGLIALGRTLRNRACVGIHAAIGQRRYGSIRSVAIESKWRGHRSALPAQEARSIVIGSTGSEPQVWHRATGADSPECSFFDTV